MRQWRFSGRAVGAAVAVVAGVVASVVVVTPGQAGRAPVRETATSGYDAEPVKEVTVTCPGPGLRVYALGYAVQGGLGAVVVTRAEPNADLTAVRVEARARTGFTGTWSVEAAAVCNTSTSDPVAETTVVHGVSSTGARCPDRTTLTGIGFRYEGPVDVGHVTALVPNAGLTRVDVRAGGPPPAMLSATAICRVHPESAGVPGVRVTTTTGLAAAAPTRVVAGVTTYWVYAVGVEAGPGAVPDVLMPDPDAGVGRAQVTRARSGNGFRTVGLTDDGLSTTVHVLAGPSFH